MKLQWYDCIGFPYRKAGPFWRFVLKRLGFAAITLPWSIYVLEEWRHDPRLARHEFQHVAQMRNDGMLRWWIKAAYYIIRYGYMNSPYEIDARRVQNNAS